MFLWFQPCLLYGNITSLISSSSSGRPERMSYVCLGINPLSCLDLLRLQVPHEYSTKAGVKDLDACPRLVSIPTSTLVPPTPFPSRGNPNEKYSHHPLNPHVSPRNFTETLLCYFYCNLFSLSLRYRSWGQGWGQLRDRQELYWGVPIPITNSLSLDNLVTFSLFP